MRFRYRAYNADGQEVRDLVEAADINEATDSLRRKGVVVAEIAEENDAVIVKRKLRLGGGGQKTLVMILRQLAVLVSTGTPVVDALGALERQCRDAHWKGILADVGKQVEEGSSLADAMNEHSRDFDPVCRSLVAAGESSGRLEEMLNRLAALARQQMHIKNSVFGAMVYPLLLIVVAVGVLTLMIGFVLPRFAGLFETLDMPLPTTTKFLMALSGIMRSYWWAIISVVIAFGVGFPIWLKSMQGKRVRDTVLIRLPQVGRIARSLATARLLRILGVLLESKVPLLDSLVLTKAACTNMHYEQLVETAEEFVTRGDSLSHALYESPLIDPSVCEAIRNGEQNGQLAPVMLGMADYLDDENEVIVRSLTSILEPVILIVLGVLVGIVAISMFLPLFDLTSMAGQGG